MSAEHHRIACFYPCEPEHESLVRQVLAEFIYVSPEVMKTQGGVLFSIDMQLARDIGVISPRHQLFVALERAIGRERIR